MWRQKKKGRGKIDNNYLTSILYICKITFKPQTMNEKIKHRIGATLFALFVASGTIVISHYSPVMQSLVFWI